MDGVGDMLKLNGLEVVFEKYANGEFCLKEAFLESISLFNSKSENVIEWSYRGNDDFLKLALLKGHLDYILGKEAFVNNDFSLDLIINYLPYSRMDRRGNEEYPFTLEIICNLIKSLNFNNISVIECHSDVGLSLLDAHQVLLNKDLLEIVKCEIEFNDAKDFIVYPDKGAKLRYESELGFGIHCDKTRDFESGRIKSLNVVESDIEVKENSKAIIVDDLCSFGNTFILASNELKRLGFKEIYLLVCHSENNIFKGNVLLDDNFNKVYTTNSILTNNMDWCNVKYKENLKIFTI